MKIRQLHPWQVSYKEAIAIQNQLQEQLILENRVRKLEFVAGADVSYSKVSKALFAAVVVLKFPELVEVEKATAMGEAQFPYVPGLLTFREAPVLLQAFEKLRTQPDAVIFDGQGIAHPRKMGLAAHLGLILDLPTAGCAKKKLVGKYNAVGPAKGDYAPILHNGQVVGVAMRTRPGVKTVFVSPGHKMDLHGAIQLILSTLGRYRLPEPTRQAHISVNQLRSQFSTDNVEKSWLSLSS